MKLVVLSRCRVTGPVVRSFIAFLGESVWKGGRAATRIAIGNDFCTPDDTLCTSRTGQCTLFPDPCAYKPKPCILLLVVCTKVCGGCSANRGRFAATNLAWTRYSGRTLPSADRGESCVVEGSGVTVENFTVHIA